MGLCFVGQKKRFGQFLGDYLAPSTGTVVDMESGKVVGKHQGLWNWTIGQNAKIPGLPERAFVAKKDKERNIVYVVQGRCANLFRSKTVFALNVIPASTHPDLYSNIVLVQDFRWIWSDSPPAELYAPAGFRALAKIRHRMEPSPCIAYADV